MPILQTWWLLTKVWTTCNIIYKCVICAQTSNRLKSVRKWQFLSRIFSDIWMTRGCAWQRIPWDRELKIFRIPSVPSVRVVLINFRKVFGHFGIWAKWFDKPWWKSHALHQKKLADIQTAILSSYIVQEVPCVPINESQNNKVVTLVPQIKDCQQF